jgi:hypothetical protein
LGDVLSVLCRLSKPLRILGLPLVSAVFFSLSGGHWMVLQALAWAQMVRDYSKNEPIMEAIQRTFSGSTPCMMCKKIAEEQQKEEKAPTNIKLDKKSELFPLAAWVLLKKPESKDFFCLPWGETAFAERSEALPSPIPILA